MQQSTENGPPTLNLNTLENLDETKLQQMQQLIKSGDLFSSKIEVKQYNDVQIYNYNNSMTQGDFVM